MGKILVTGATGNVGQEVVKALRVNGEQVISAVVHATGSAASIPADSVAFDFADRTTWNAALEGVDRVFLMRPPAISDVKQYLFPFIDALLEINIKQIVFLSLQGVQFNPLTPHYKVERYMRQKKAPYTFLRPNFFMQNLTTFYKDDIRERNEIFLPAGKGKTAFVDVRDIGAVAALVLGQDGHVGKAYTLSGVDSLNYYDVAKVLSATLGRAIVYKNPSQAQYTDRLKTQGANEDFIKVQKMLFFVVRHNFSSGTSPDIETLLQRPPISFKQFTQDYAHVWGSK